MAVRKQKKKAISQESWSPGEDADVLMDIMSRVTDGLMSHRDVDLDPKPLAELAAKVSGLLLEGYDGIMEDADMEEEAKDAVFDLYLSTISAAVQHTPAEELATRAGLAELVKVCVRHTGPLWEAYASISGDDEEEEEDDDG
jgi:hypothetical protein